MKEIPSGKTRRNPPGSSTGAPDPSRREFLRRSVLIAGGLAFVSCNDLVAPVVNSPGRLPGYRDPKKVVIIGAGIAGLVAGFELSRAGHHVTILEARPRIGGRVLTLREPFTDGHLAEAGAARIPSNHHLTIAYAEYFDLELVPFYSRGGLYVKYSGGIRSFIPASSYLNSPPWPGSVNRGEYTKIRVGTDRLPRAFADSLANTIHLSTPVESVAQNLFGVTVRTAGGTVYAADRVLCTVPLTVLNRIQFTPALSPLKMQAAGGGYNYAPSTRVFMQFSTRFWEMENLNGWGNTDWPEEIWQPTWDREGPRGVLMSYLRYDRAREIDPLTEERRIESVLTRWGNVFPGVRDHLDSGASYSWFLDPWSAGAWADPTPAQDAALRTEIGRAEGRIHFAGEHDSLYHGWMQGALVSGLRGAVEIHHADGGVG